MSATGGPNTVRLREVPFLAQVELRLEPSEEEAARRCAASFLGCSLPPPGRSRGHDGVRVLWCGPGWYLVLAAGPDVTGHGIACGLESCLGTEYGTPCASVVDVSAQRTVLELSGPHARDVLAHGCPLDLHRDAFPTGAFTQTLLARVDVGVLCAEAENEYRVLVRSSFAEHLALWLLDAMTEYVGTS
ncbi:hypothetical protein J4H86_06180 [Spiractinospora alimapuensis]|nr:hypothetical protein J4H86_06180 [Spiractinospora alimapuensis]